MRRDRRFLCCECVRQLLGEITGWLLQNYPGSFIVNGGGSDG